MQAPLRAFLPVCLLALLASCGGGGGGGGGGTDQLPVANDVSVTLMSGSRTATITLSGSVPDGATAHFVVLETPQHCVVSLDALTGVAQVHLPNAHFTGTASFRYVVTDEHNASSPASATISVLQDPTAEPLLVSVAKQFTSFDGDGRAGSGHRAVSDDGRYVAFASDARNLVDDGSSSSDIYVRDMFTGTTELVSCHSDGTAGNGNSQQPLLSGDGNLVLFQSTASNLVDDDTNGTGDLFLHDRRSASTVRVSLKDDGTQSTTATYNYDMSADGRFIVFVAGSDPLTADDADPGKGLYLLDRASTSLTYIAPIIIPEEDDTYRSILYRPQVSDDGRTVLFTTTASDIAATDDDLNDALDIYRWDADTATVSGVSTRSRTDQQHCVLPTLSGDGSVIMFTSTSMALDASITDTDRYRSFLVRSADNSLSVLDDASVLADNGFGLPIMQLSADGRFCIYTHDADDPDHHQVRKRDLHTGTDTLVGPPVDREGVITTPAISADGRYVTFISGWDHMVAGDTNGATDAFWVDTIAGPASIRRVSDIPIDRIPESNPNAQIDLNDISGDGRFIVFETSADNMLNITDNNDLDDVFRFDCETGETIAVSVDDSGSLPTNAQAQSGSISDDGRFVAFHSSGELLTDTNEHEIIQTYMRDVLTGTTQLISLSATPPHGGNAPSGLPDIGANGETVVFVSAANDLTADAKATVGSAAVFDVYAADVASGLISLVSRSITAGTGGNNSGWELVLSDDGMSCIFTSTASDLIAADTNEAQDVFAADLTTGTISRISVANDGSEANKPSYSPSVSADGNRICFVSRADNLTSEGNPGRTMVYLRDRSANSTILISKATDGDFAGGQCGQPQIASDGSFIVFSSSASDLIADDTNGQRDIFLFDSTTGAISRIVEGAGDSRISRDGRYLVYQSLLDGQLYRRTIMPNGGG